MRVVDFNEFYTSISMINKSETHYDVDTLKEIYTLLIDNNIDNGERMAAFLGNLAHESAGLQRREENLNYSAGRLRQVWPSRFKSLAKAKRFAYNPKALANCVYNGRMGNRPGSDDGWRYRGGGYFQLTGSNNYRRAQERLCIRIHQDPDLVRQDDFIAWQTSVDYFVNRRYRGKSLLQWADMGSHRSLCRAINGGLHGLSERKMVSRRLYEVFGENEGLFVMPLLQRGERGAHVRQLQCKLRDLGYKIYGIDGIYGENTYRQVVAFQQDNGLNVDGVLGGNTYELINTLIEKERDLSEYDQI